MNRRPVPAPPTHNGFLVGSRHADPEQYGRFQSVNEIITLDGEFVMPGLAGIFYFAAPSADLAFDFAAGGLAAAFGGALSPPRIVPQGSELFCCSGMLPSDLR